MRRIVCLLLVFWCAHSFLVWLSSRRERLLLFSVTVLGVLVALPDGAHVRIKSARQGIWSPWKITDGYRFPTKLWYRHHAALCDTHYILIKTKQNKANSTNLYPPTKGYLRETCKSRNIKPIYLTLSSPTVSFRS